MDATLETYTTDVCIPIKEKLTHQTKNSVSHYCCISSLSCITANIVLNKYLTSHHHPLPINPLYPFSCLCLLPGELVMEAWKQLKLIREYEQRKKLEMIGAMVFNSAGEEKACFYSIVHKQDTL